ncbi:S24/S26 family peptidase [Haloimpatiens sp. FM7315]|uniref:S24/S26 family peptidase n=1 Tax=Haloimpatiens sp. FM7315 TaxID=3298609 RepID=UPI0035A268C0
MNSTYEKELGKHGSFTFVNVGTSMMPLLRQHKDLFVIEKKPGLGFRKYDVVLFKRNSGQYVLHRILKVRSSDYVLCGDNRFKLEYGVTEDNMLGVMTKVIRDGVTISVTDKKYQIYVHLWCDFFYIRAAILWIKLFLYKSKRKLRKIMAE